VLIGFALMSIDEPRTLAAVLKVLFGFYQEDLHPGAGRSAVGEHDHETEPKSLPISKIPYDPRPAGHET
jgi:hypothetical protein